MHELSQGGRAQGRIRRQRRLRQGQAARSGRFRRGTVPEQEVHARLDTAAPRGPRRRLEQMSCVRRVRNDSRRRVRGVDAGPRVRAQPLRVHATKLQRLLRARVPPVQGKRGPCGQDADHDTRRIRRVSESRARRAANRSAVGASRTARRRVSGAVHRGLLQRHNVVVSRPRHLVPMSDVRSSRRQRHYSC